MSESPTDDGDELVECTECDRSFDSVRGMKIHRTRTHSDHEEASCPACDRKFGSRRAMRRHHTAAHGESLLDAECKQCGSEFRKQRDEVKYCSPECAVEERSGENSSWWKGGQVEKTCEECGEIYQCDPNESDRRRFCSHECYFEASSEGARHPTVNCEFCGKEFEVKPCRSEIARFCSRQCTGKYRAGKWTEEKNPRWNPDHDGSAPYGPLWREQREVALDRDGYLCQDCGMSDEEHIETYGQDIDVHHIVPAVTFEGETEAHQLDNLVTLCRPCHARWEVRIRRK